MDKQTIFLSADRQFKRIIFAGLCILSAACATTGQETGDAAAVEEPPTGADSDAMMHIATAERLVDVGEYDAALEEYLAAARVSPDPAVARMVTRLAGRLQAWPAAVAAAERWLELEPGAESASHVRIVGLVNQGQVEAAADALGAWLAAFPEAESPNRWRRAAMLLAAAEAGHAERAFALLVDRAGPDARSAEIAHAESIMLWHHGQLSRARERALESTEDTEDVDYLVWAAQLAAEDDDLEQALALYRRARTSDPDAASLALAEAEVLRQLERSEEALSVLRGLPQDSESLYTLGIYLVQLERTEEAEQAWLALSGLPAERRGDEHAFLTAQLAEMIGRDEEALAWYEQVTAGVRAQQALLRRALVLGRLERLDEAGSLLAGLREQANPELRLDTWLIEAEMLRTSGRSEEAIELLAEPLAENPGNADLLYARALSAATAGNVELAEQDLRRMIQMDGNNAMALNALGYTLTDQTDRHEEAYRLIRRALELDPEDPATLDSMGWVLFRLGRAEEAVPFLERALDGDENPEILAHLIEVLDHLGRQQEADALVERALAEHGEDRYLRETLERLGRLP